MDKNIVVLGGGISGLSAAWRLTTQGIAVDVLEADSCIGGLAKTIRENGYCLNVGPHSFFSEDNQIIQTVLDLFDYKLEPMQRTVKFFYKDKYLDYPLTAQGVLLQMGLLSGIRVALSYMKEKIFPRRSSTLGTEEETVEDWAIASFGEHLYRTFFKPYTEQFWKVSCLDLASRSIPTHTRMSFLNTLRVILHQKATKTGESLIERESLPAYHPRTGFGEIAERIADTIKRYGGNVHLNCKVVGIRELPGGKVCVVYERNGRREEISADYIVSTIQLPLLIKMLSPQPPAEVLASADKLDYRSLVVLGMTTEKQRVLGCGYIYLLDRPYNRITEMNEFSPQTSPPGENIIEVEIPCLYNSAAWNASKEELFDMCISSLAEDGFLGPGDVKKLFVIKSPAAYPIYRKGYAKHLDCILNYIKTQRSIAALGRCGEFMYMDIDICMKRAFDFADNLLKKF